MYSISLSKQDNKRYMELADELGFLEGGNESEWSTFDTAVERLEIKEK